jgi:hypothetical protein
MEAEFDRRKASSTASPASTASSRTGTASPLARQIARVPPAQDRRAVLTAVQKGDLAKAATLLATMSDADVTDVAWTIAGRENGVDTLDQLVGQTSGSAAQILAAVRKRRADTLAVYTAYTDAKNVGDHQKMLNLLNGMARPDIERRVNALDLDTVTDLDKRYNETMFGWPGPLHDVLLARRAALVAGPTMPEVDRAAEKPSTSKAVPQPDPVKRTLRDLKAARYGAVDYDDFVRNMLVGGGGVFGATIPPNSAVHPVLLARLRKATAIAEKLQGSNNFGVMGIGGIKDADSEHTWGLAVDFDTGVNWYVANEHGEKALDARLLPIYQRIATKLLHRDSVITPTALPTATFDQLADENDAMIAYFGTLGLEGISKDLPHPRGRDLTFRAEDLRKLVDDRAQVQNDYTVLITPKHETKDEKGKVVEKGDGPAVSGNSKSVRNPTRGFLGINQYMVAALKQVGLTWGATGFGPESGDVMHFDARGLENEVVAYGQAHPTPARAKQDGH